MQSGRAKVTALLHQKVAHEGRAPHAAGYIDLSYRRHRRCRVYVWRGWLVRAVIGL